MRAGRDSRWRRGGGDAGGDGGGTEGWADGALLDDLDGNGQSTGSDQESKPPCLGLGEVSGDDRLATGDARAALDLGCDLRARDDPLIENDRNSSSGIPEGPARGATRELGPLLTPPSPKRDRYLPGGPELRIDDRLRVADRVAVEGDAGKSEPLSFLRG
jgi:hypothetical protein